MDFNHHAVEYQAVRRSDNRTVTWFRDLTGEVGHLLPAVSTSAGYTPLDMRTQWNGRDFYAKVYPAPRASVATFDQ